MRGFAAVFTALLVAPFSGLHSQELLPFESVVRSRAMVPDLDSNRQGGTRSLCFHPRPRPACATSLITEVTGAVKFAGQNVSPVQAASVNFGLTYHLDARYAIGGSTTYVLQNGAPSFGALKARARAWLSPSLTVDFSPGLILRVDGDTQLPELQTADTLKWRYADSWGPGLTLDAAIGFRDWVAAFVRVDLLQYGAVYERNMVRIADTSGGYSGFVWNGQVWEDADVVTRAESGTVGSAFVGVRAGSYPGLGAVGLASVIAGIWYLWFIASYEGN